MRAFGETYILPALKADFDDNVFNKKGCYRLDPHGLAQFYSNFYKSLYPQLSSKNLYELYLLASDVVFAAYVAQQKQESRISQYWKQYSFKDFEFLIEADRVVQIDKKVLPFEHYFADYLIHGTTSKYYDYFIQQSTILGSGFIFFMLANCFRAMCGNLYSSPTIEKDDLTRFIPYYKGSLKEFPFLFDEKIPFFYTYDLKADDLLDYIFTTYDLDLLKTIWVNFLSERIPEAATDENPIVFMGNLFDKAVFWVQGNWTDFVDDKYGLDWIIRYNNSPELIFHFKRTFYWYFKNHQNIKIFSLS
jgi:hypothetical protein